MLFSFPPWAATKWYASSLEWFVKKIFIGKLAPEKEQVDREVSGWVPISKEGCTFSKSQVPDSSGCASVSRGRWSWAHLCLPCRICSGEKGCGAEMCDSTVLGNYWLVLLSEVPQARPILVFPTSITLMHTVLLNLTLLSQKDFCWFMWICIWGKQWEH